MPYTPNRGDLVWLRSGSRGKRRPALVLSPVTYNRKVGLALFCLITSQIKGYPFEVPVPDGMNLAGAILADQLKSLDWKEQTVELIGRVSSDVISEVLSKLHTLL
jgi:mRNA interferase MazF